MPRNAKPGTSQFNLDLPSSAVESLRRLKPGLMTKLFTLVMSQAERHIANDVGVFEAAIANGDIRLDMKCPDDEDQAWEDLMDDIFYKIDDDGPINRSVLLDHFTPRMEAHGDPDRILTAVLNALEAKRFIEVDGDTVC